MNIKKITFTKDRKRDGLLFWLFIAIIGILTPITAGAIIPLGTTLVVKWIMSGFQVDGESVKLKRPGLKDVLAYIGAIVSLSFLSFLIAVALESIADLGWGYQYLNYVLLAVILLTIVPFFSGILIHYYLSRCVVKDENVIVEGNPFSFGLKMMWLVIQKIPLFVLTLGLYSFVFGKPLIEFMISRIRIADRCFTVGEKFTRGHMAFTSIIASVLSAITFGIGAPQVFFIQTRDFLDEHLEIQRYRSA